MKRIQHHKLFKKFVSSRTELESYTGFTPAQREFVLTLSNRGYTLGIVETKIEALYSLNEGSLPNIYNETLIPDHLRRYVNPDKYHIITVYPNSFYDSENWTYDLFHKIYIAKKRFLKKSRKSLERRAYWVGVCPDGIPSSSLERIIDQKIKDGDIPGHRG